MSKIIKKFVPIKLGVSFDSSILFLGNTKNQKLIDIYGKDYCLLQVLVTLNKDTFMSE